MGIFGEHVTPPKPYDAGGKGVDLHTGDVPVDQLSVIVSFSFCMDKTVMSTYGMKGRFSGNKIQYEYPLFQHFASLHLTSRQGTNSTNPQEHIMKIFKNAIKTIPVSDYSASVSKAVLSSYKAYLSIEDIIDIRSLASNTSSTQALAVNNAVYSLGEIIKVNIRLYDGYGKPLTYGGDVLRIWLTSTANNANANGYVIDHGNGSYTGHVIALWTGKSVIKTSIAATKEQIAVVQKYIEKHGLLHDMVAGFTKDNVVERTPCSVKPDVLGLTDMCNFTNDNYGLHWFCGKPSNPSLNCKDWKFTKGHRTDHLTKPERKIARIHKHMHLQKSPEITIAGSADFVQSPDLPCYKRPSKETWLEESPVGFYYHGKWHQRGCTNTFIPTKISYENCLRNQYLFLIGDSNIRSWFDHIKVRVNMKIPKNKQGLTGQRWFSLREAERQDLNLTLLWAVHELPFYTGEDSPREHIKSVAWYIDRVPTRENVTIVIHNMMHFARTTPSEFRAHIRNVKFAIGRLFKRVPGARVFVKGPHSATFIDLLKPLDYIRKIHEQLFYEEFKEFHDKITYLNEWDITTSIDNTNVHPSQFTVSDMVNNFMLYLCEV
ncbi:NXPE family member 4-like [Ylistrum balloti]|uniref:NXPE family member 4-like n=1 Tax=Ylistrum balloti TaxID=509963 RepID=UPI002905E058|nr:NXPE family member 4-like [Ylistrum balloti]